MQDERQKARAARTAAGTARAGAGSELTCEYPVAVVAIPAVPVEYVLDET